MPWGLLGWALLIVIGVALAIAIYADYRAGSGRT